MDIATQNASAPLLHATAMMLFPAIMGLSTTLCLRSRPSPFSVVAVHEYVALTKWLDRAWLVPTLGWATLALLRATSGAPSASSPLWLTGAVVATVLILARAHLWFQSVVATELARMAASVSEAGPLTTVSDDGVCVAQRRESDGTLLIASANRGVRIYLWTGLVVLALFVAATIVAVAESAGPTVAQCVLLAGLYVSFGVFLVDLCLDVWPGFTTGDRVKRASRYYVQVFEEWKNPGVLAGFLTVLIGAPMVYAAGDAPLSVMSFPIWIAGCLCVATFVNEGLHRRGLVRDRLPLPVWVNAYSLTNPLWAHFFAVIHLVMAAALAVGLVVLGI